MWVSEFVSIFCSRKLLDGGSARCYLSFFFKIVIFVFFFILSPLSIYSQVLGHSYGLGLMVLAFRQIDWLLPLCALNKCMQDTIVLSKALCLTLRLYFSFGCRKRTLYYPKILAHRGEDSRHQLNFSTFTKLCRHYLLQWGLALRLWRASYSLSYTLFGDSHETPLSNYSFTCNQIPLLELN